MDALSASTKRAPAMSVDLGAAVPVAGATEATAVVAAAGVVVIVAKAAVAAAAAAVTAAQAIAVAATVAIPGATRSVALKPQEVVLLGRWRCHCLRDRLCVPVRLVLTLFPYRRRAKHVNRRPDIHQAVK